MSIVFKFNAKTLLYRFTRDLFYTLRECVFSDIYVLSAFIYKISAFFVHVKENVSACVCEVRGTQRPPLVIVGMNKRD